MIEIKKYFNEFGRTYVYVAKDTELKKIVTGNTKELAEKNLIDLKKYLEKEKK